MRYSQTNKESGVVMILILVFLTMFAMMVSAFLFMTSSMSDSAASSLAHYEKGETVRERSDADVDNAIRTLLIGTNNEASPIGPFSILENLYGDPTTMEGLDGLAVQWFNLRAEYNGTIPTKAFVEIDLASETQDYAAQLINYYEDRIDRVMKPSGTQPVDPKLGERLRKERELLDNPATLNSLFEDVKTRLLESGSTLSFGTLHWTENSDYDGDDYAAIYLNMCRSFNNIVSGSSTQIIRKEIVSEPDEDVVLRLELALSEELKQFLTLWHEWIGAPWPNNAYAAYNAFRLNANIRLNPPVFSGTGAGGFSPNGLKDGQLTGDALKNAFFPEVGTDTPIEPARLPFAFWGNAAAPDLTPHRDLVGKTSFQTFWRHLADRNFFVYTPVSKETICPYYDYKEMDWHFATDAQVTPHEPIRMNPGYTAVDQRNLFLAGLTFQGNKPKPTPSFVRPETLFALRKRLESTEADENPSQILALLRKATPRPLRADHWNWTGSNNNMLPSPYPNISKDTVIGELDKLIAADVAWPRQWDVDNDNDGIKDGIWIPSGLPIRVDENGTPYATMYSFTVLDMDGRVNVNTAGNWNQLPYPGVNHYTKLTNDDENGLVDLAELFSAAAADPNSPWYSFENLKGGLGWFDDTDEEITTDSFSRGTGLGPAGIDLTAALTTMFDPHPSADRSQYGENAANILTARYFSSAYGSLSATKALPDLDDYPLFDGLGLGLESGFSNIAQIALRGQLRQPSAYYAEPNSAVRTDPSQWISDDSDEHRRFYLHTDAVYRGDKNGTLADPELFLFPWRGKTRVFDYGVSAGSPHYPKKYSSYPTFDFCDTALRSYDPLGNDLLTYMPKYSENPYLVNPYGSTQKDSTFTAEMLELLLRPFDYDRKSRNTALLEALLGDKVSDALDNPQKDEYNRLRSDITTISSDIPVPASALSVGITEVPDGVFGIRQLIRRCVLLEIYKANREKKSADDFAFDNDYIKNKKIEFSNNTGISTENEEWNAQFRSYLRSSIEEGVVARWKDEDGVSVLDKITDQLFALLPQDIREGRRLDLNALSHKACWIDSVYEEQDDGTFVKTLPTGTVDDATREEFDYYHQLGLVERMKFARGLFVLLMTLTYEDRNAETVRDFYDNDPDARLTDDDTYKDYLEGCDKQYIEKLTSTSSSESDDEKKARLNAELIANRIAQYCVNLVDFTDPDATMTPFFYDPNPFDGWWSYKMPDINILDETEKGNFDFVLYTPSTKTETPNIDLYDALIPAMAAPDAEISNKFVASDGEERSLPDYVNEDLSDKDGQPISFIDNDANEPDRYSKALVSWLNGQAILQSGDGTGIGEYDFGFRLIWGMERPDLLLTETLNFHDLGIADTKLEVRNNRGSMVADNGDDQDFDQARRPLGSTYLELYCAANPNIPQSPELYQFDKDRNLWKLELSKMTPQQKADSPYEGKQFPVWRVAITASTDPRKKEEQGKEFTDMVKVGDDEVPVPYIRTIRKEKNSIVERLLGENADQRTFSLRTRQFCDLVIDSSGNKSLDEKLNSRWRGYDYKVANLLGPCAEPADKDEDFADEVEIDRIVWFGWPKKSDDSTFDTISEFPDAAHIFGRVKETTEDKLTTSIFPNQYLVVAPAEKRAIGSLNFGSPAAYFGIPSPIKLEMTNLREANTGKWTNSDYILAGTYNGLDINSNDKLEVNKRGINISEPLWFRSNDPDTPYKDPYPDTIPLKPDFEYEGERITVTNNDTGLSLPDHPFELPTSDTKNDQYPIAADHLLGLGTMPGIRSAFVQRVADPNRPYHPFANPYISVDWNMMDLTVFNGERNGLEHQADSQNPFNKGADKNEIDENNHIIVPKSSFMKTDGTFIKFDIDSTTTPSGIFSSRCWLDPKQKGFLPVDQDPASKPGWRPNVWARPLSIKGLQDNNAGLREADSIENIYSNLKDLYNVEIFLQPNFQYEVFEKIVVHLFPKHTLGAYNDAENRFTDLDSQFPSAANTENLRELYYGSPTQEDSDESFQPFEHLVWNDAPFSSPAEILLVPASAPSRFGLEYIRNSNHKDKGKGNTQHHGFHFAFMFQDGAEDDLHGRLGRSLGSDGGTGLSLFGGGNEDGKNFLGPYLNFFHTSGIKGNSLNLSTLFDFVTVPSLYMGTQVFCGYDDNGDPIYKPTLREPGKININTAKESGLKGILPNLESSDKINMSRGITPFKSGYSPSLELELTDKSGSGEEGSEDGSKRTAAPGDSTLLRFVINDELPPPEKRTNNLNTATEDLRKLSGLTTNRSNVFAVWLTVGYFAVERARPGVNMPSLDPDGLPLPTTDPTTEDEFRYLNLPTTHKYYDYYKAIYPDGYTYGKELGSGGVDTEGVNRPRAFYLIDRSIPVDFRRGRSWNWTNTILLQRKL